MKREDVYKIIDSERDYQEKRWNDGLRGDSIPDKDKSLAEWVVYMDCLLTEAKQKIYWLKKEEALGMIRKVTAVGVAAMEVHGAPKRDEN